MWFCLEAPKLFYIYDLVPGLKENQFPVLKLYVLAPKTSKLHNFLTVIPFYVIFVPKESETKPIYPLYHIVEIPLFVILYYLFCVYCLFPVYPLSRTE
jgi:hypothetical protein